MTIQSSFACQLVAGQRTADFVATSQVSDPGTVTAISADQPVTILSATGSPPAILGKDGP